MQESSENCAIINNSAIVITFCCSIKGKENILIISLTPAAPVATVSQIDERILN